MKILILALAIAHAGVRLKVTPPANASLKTDMIEVIGVADNGDGTSTLALTACGSLIEAIVTAKEMKTANTEIERLINQAINEACK